MTDEVEDTTATVVEVANANTEASLGDILAGALAARQQTPPPVAETPATCEHDWQPHEDGMLRCSHCALTMAAPVETHIVPDPQAAGGVAEVTVPITEPVAPAYPPPPEGFPSDLSMAALLARGYHIISPGDDCVDLSSLDFSTYRLVDRIYDTVRPTVHYANLRSGLPNKWAGEHPRADCHFGHMYKLPILFVKKSATALKKGGRLYEPVSDWGELESAIDNLGDMYVSGRNGRRARGLRSAAREAATQVFKSEYFGEVPDEENRRQWFPDNLVLHYDIDRRRVVSIGYEITVVINDEQPIVSNFGQEEAPSRRATSRSSSSTAKRSTFVYDTKGLLFWGRTLDDGIERQAMYNVDELWTSITDHMAIPAADRPQNIILNNITVIEPEMLNTALENVGFPVIELAIDPLVYRYNSSRCTWIYSSGTLASVAAYNRHKNVAIDESRYARLYIDKFTKMFKKKRAQLDKDITTASQTLMSASQRKGEIVLMLDLLELKGVEVLQQKFASLAELPGIESSRFTSAGIEIITDEINYEHSTQGNKFLGKYRFVVNLLNNGITIQNLMLSKEKQVSTPSQGRYGGYFCLGSYPSVIGAALAAADYTTLVLTLLEYVRQPREDDINQGPNLKNHFGKARPKTPIVGEEYRLFTAANYNFNGLD